MMNVRPDMPGTNDPALGVENEAGRRRSPLIFLPLIAFAALAGLLFLRLFAGDASRLPSALIGKSVPSFALAPVAGLGKPGLATADLRTGRVTILNVFASWCVPCREETPALVSLAKSGQHLVGIAYKDKPDATRRFLKDDGDPFAAIGDDETGRTGIDFGVYGVPETYVVDGAGIIVAKLVGPLTKDTIRTDLMPAIAKAKP